MSWLQIVDSTACFEKNWSDEGKHGRNGGSRGRRFSHYLNAMRRASVRRQLRQCSALSSQCAFLVDRCRYGVEVRNSPRPKNYCCLRLSYPRVLHLKARVPEELEHEPRSTITRMPVHNDHLLPIHPLRLPLLRPHLRTAPFHQQTRLIPTDHHPTRR